MSSLPHQHDRTLFSLFGIDSFQNVTISSYLTLTSKILRSLLIYVHQEKHSYAMGSRTRLNMTDVCTTTLSPTCNSPSRRVSPITVQCVLIKESSKLTKAKPKVPCRAPSTQHPAPTNLGWFFLDQGQSEKSPEKTNYLFFGRRILISSTQS